MPRLKGIGSITLGSVLSLSAWGQSNPGQNPSIDSREEHKPKPGAGREIGAGGATIGTGAAKGTGAVAKGTAKGAAELVTLHPIHAGKSIGKGAATGGEDIAVGAVKGTTKVTKGIGRAFKKLF